MTIYLTDLHEKRFYPLTLTRPMAALRAGIFTLGEKWEKVSGCAVMAHTRPELRVKYPSILTEEVSVYINAMVLPSAELWQEILSIQQGQSLFKGETWIASRNELSTTDWPFHPTTDGRKDCTSEIVSLESPYDLFLKADHLIQQDFKLITSGRASQQPGAGNTIIGDPSLLFLEKGAKVNGAFINLEHGPIYIGEGAEVMEGSMIRGPLALGKGSILKMGTKLYGPSWFGPECRIGGEVSNSVMLGYSNKGHDGFLGNSILGEWCNLGADTNTSNLKNNYSKVRVWSYETEAMEDSGLTFCGLLMGDHSKCSINTMFNTGTVVGVSANIFGSGFPSKFIPSFSWGGSESLGTYELEKACEVAEKVCERRGVSFTAEDRQILTQAHAFSAKFRS